MPIDTVNDLPPRVQYVAAAAQEDFDYPFPIFEDGDLVVDVDGVTQALDTDYTVSGEGEDTGGTVSFVTPLIGGEIVTVYRDIAIARDTDFQQNGPFRAAAINDELDKAFLIMQQLESRIGRALRLPITAEATDAQTELSPLVNWLGKYVTVNASGIPEPAVLSSEAMTQSTIGALLYPQTQAEANAGVTPTHYHYAPGDVRRYGVTGSGDETAKLQAALSVQQDVFVPPGITINTTTAVTMLSGQTLYGLGPASAISCNGTGTSAININGKTRAIVRDLFVKCVSTSVTGLDSAAVLIYGGSQHCEVRNCRLEGSRAGVTISVADYNHIEGNSITATSTSDLGWDIGIYGGGSHNRIIGNLCYGGIGTGASTIGSSGIQVLANGGRTADYNVIADNEVGPHTQYGILIYCDATIPTATVNHTTISGNVIHDITGTYDSGLGLGFGAGIYAVGCEWFSIVGNSLYRTNVSTATLGLAPGAIGINGCSCFTVMGNTIRAPVWYGIYIVGDGNGLGSGLVQGNVITGCVSKAGVRLNTVNNITVLGNSVNGVAASDSGIIVDSGGALMEGIAVIANKVKGFSQAGCSGLFVRLCQAPKITGNLVDGNTIGYDIDTCQGGDFSGNEARDNTTYDGFFGASNAGPIFFDHNTFVSTATNGVQDSAGALLYGINSITGQTNQFVSGNAPIGRTLATSATPSVANQRLMYYGGATAVTDLLNPTPGQVLTIVSTGTPTFQHNTGSAATKLLLNGAANFVMALNNTLTLEYLPGGPWIEVGRKA